VVEQKCRACGSNDSGLLFQIRRNRVARCRKCSHVFLDVVHTPESIRMMYADYEKSHNDFYFQRIDGQVISHFDSYLRRCREYCETGSGSLRFLDIGCGNGSLLSRAQKLGFMCEGVETCRPLAEEVSRKLSCIVHTQLLSECDFDGQLFDVVTMYDLIEHLNDPIVDILRVRSWLKPGGILFVLTPNDDAMMRRAARLAYAATLGSFHYPLKRLYYSHHLSYFTASSLQAFLKTAGFDVASMETRNQEMSRLNLTQFQSFIVKTVFAASKPFPGAGGKLVAWARKPT
jgi:2-polyprenyl-3-methyl-5-hydroxy-6-metoxy-1,4-benzoquinol methylase